MRGLRNAQAFFCSSEAGIPDRLCLFKSDLTHNRPPMQSKGTRFAFSNRIRVGTRSLRGDTAAFLSVRTATPSFSFNQCLPPLECGSRAFALKAQGRSHPSRKGMPVCLFVKRGAAGKTIDLSRLSGYQFQDWRTGFPQGFAVADDRPGAYNVSMNPVIRIARTVSQMRGDITEWGCVLCRSS